MVRFCTLCFLCLFAVANGPGRKEDFDDASLDKVFGETVEVPTLKKSSAYYYEKSACEDCVSFLREMSDQVRSKRFRERAYKVVDEMCERVFDTDTDDREKTTECEAMGKTYAKKAIDYAKTLSEEDKGKAACKKMHLCKKKKKKKTRRRFWSSSNRDDGRCGETSGAARARARRVWHIFRVLVFFFLFLVAAEDDAGDRERGNATIIVVVAPFVVDVCVLRIRRLEACDGDERPGFRRIREARIHRRVRRVRDVF